MAQFHARFLDRAAADAQRIEHALAAGDLATVRSVSHGLSGNAGMFGFPHVGTSAQAVEEAVDAGVDRMELDHLVAALLRHLAALDQER